MTSMSASHIERHASARAGASTRDDNFIQLRYAVIYFVSSPSRHVILQCCTDWVRPDERTRL